MNVGPCDPAAAFLSSTSMKGPAGRGSIFDPEQQRDTQHRAAASNAVKSVRYVVVFAAVRVYHCLNHPMITVSASLLYANAPLAKHVWRDICGVMCAISLSPGKTFNQPWIVVDEFSNIFLCSKVSEEPISSSHGRWLYPL